MSSRDRILAIVGAALVVFGGGWFFIAKPQREKAAQLDEQIAAARSELGGTAARAAEYRAARNELRKHPEGFEKAGKALPNRVAMPDLLRTLTRTARGTGVKLGELTTAAGTGTTPGISTVNLDLSFEGDFLELQRYLARLQRFVEVSSKKVDAKGRLLTLNNVQLSPGEEGAGLTAKVGATVYVLQPGALTLGAPGAVGAPGAAAATPATPGAPAATTTAPAAPAAAPTPAGGA